MAKTKEQKVKLINDYKEKIGKAKSVVIVDYKGLKVKESELLRSKLLSLNSEFIVTKNSLLKIALKDKNIDIPENYYEKPLAMSLSYQDEIVGVKELDLFTKEHENLEIVGGLMGDMYLDKDKVAHLAALPTKEELYAKVVGTIAAPVSGMVNVLSANIRGLLNVLNQYCQKSN